MSMYGVGILKGLGVTLKHFVDTFVDDIKWLGRREELEVFQQRQSLANKGLVTVEYPDEKLAVPERFRFVPFLVTYNSDDPEYPSKDWCTSCGICAKVCPPQCIWIVRGTNAETGRPKPEPEQFYIDIDICMNCGYCAEYCPFDAIKMDHDYELASFDRTGNHVFDLSRLSKPLSYWEHIAPTTAAEELAARGGYDHSDVQKSRKKAGLPATRSGPVSDKAAVASAPVAATPAVATPVATPTAPTASAAPAAPQAETTADGKKIVRRRGATAPKPEGTAEAAPAASATPPAAAAPAPVAQASAPTATPAAAAPVATASVPEEAAPGGMIKRGKRLIDPNNPGPVKRRTRTPNE